MKAGAVGRRLPGTLRRPSFTGVGTVVAAPVDPLAGSESGSPVEGSRPDEPVSEARRPGASAQREPMTYQPNASTPTSRPASVHDRLLDHGRRERRPWSILLSALGVLASASVVLLLEGSALLHLVAGLSALLILLVVHLAGQRRLLRETRLALMRELELGQRSLKDSMSDPLTGLFNRRYMDYLLEVEASRAGRTGGTFSLLMVDVDGFKQINDRHGHVAGDRFLKQVSDVLERTFRKSDVVIRFGGDEFVALLPNTSESQARIAAERLSREVASWNARRGPHDAEMRLSCGVAEYAPGNALTALIELADRRMYADKSRVGTATDAGARERADLEYVLAGSPTSPDH